MYPIQEIFFKTESEGILRLCFQFYPENIYILNTLRLNLRALSFVMYKYSTVAPRILNYGSDCSIREVTVLLE